MKKVCSILLCVGMVLSLCSCGDETVLKSDYDALEDDYDDLQTQYDELNEKYSNLEDEYNSLEDEYDELAEEYNALLPEETETSDIDYSSITTDMFRTDITYDNLSRNPDDYEGELFKMSGTIIQVVEGDDYTDYRVATSGSYDNVIYLELENEILDERLLEDDKITFYAVSCNTYTYESTLGGYITIPAAFVYIIERN